MGDFYRVGQVVFLLAVVAVQPAQRLQQKFCTEPVSPGIDLGNLTLLRGGILFLHDAQHPLRVVQIAQDASVAGRIGNLCGNQRHLGCRLPMLFQRTGQNRIVDKRRVGIQHDHIAVRMGCQEIPRHHNRMACSLALLLENRDAVFRQNLTQALGVLPDHNADFLHACLAAPVYDPANHRLKQNLTHRFWIFGFHSGSFACCQNDCTSCSHLISLHSELLFCFSLL